MIKFPKRTMGLLMPLFTMWIALSTYTLAWSEETLSALSNNGAKSVFSNPASEEDFIPLRGIEQHPLHSIPAIAIRQDETTKDASLMIEKQEVIRLRSTLGNETAAERMQVVQARLMTFLQAGGRPNEIQPGEDGKNIVVRAGHETLVTIDSQTAQKSHLLPKQVAYQWTNRIRTALGGAPLERNGDLIASRGFSPALTNLRATLLDTSHQMFHGMASWYGPGFNGRRSSNGERFNMNELTAAHRSLPFNTRVKVTNSHTGKSAIVRITDRGPYARNRILDLSKGAARAVGMLSSGTAPITMEVLGR